MVHALAHSACMITARTYGLLLSNLLLALSTLSSPAATPHTVTLAWNPSTPNTIAGYHLYVGTASKVYTNIVDSGGSTSVSVTNLSGGVTYYFAVTAYSPIGLESDFSNEISYTAPSGGPATLRITMSPTSGVQLSGSAPSGYQYQVLRSDDLKSWTSVGNVTASTSGSFQFTDAVGTNRARSYRLRQTSP